MQQKRCFMRLYYEEVYSVRRNQRYAICARVDSEGTFFIKNLIWWNQNGISCVYIMEGYTLSDIRSAVFSEPKNSISAA